MKKLIMLLLILNSIIYSAHDHTKAKFKKLSAHEIKAKDISTNHLHVFGDEEVCGDLYVDGFITASSIDVIDGISVGDLVVDSLTVVTDAVIGGTTTTSSLDVLADATIGCNLDVGCLLTASALDILTTTSLSNLEVLSDVVVEGSITTSTLDVLGDQSVGGDLAIDGSISSCDVIVGCNILMQNSTSPLIGNVLKNGTRFIHNTGTDNTFVGVSSGNFTTTGFNNTALGTNALTSIVAGNDNIAIGANALFNAINNFNNIAIGTFSLGGIGNTGSSNIGIGFAAMSFITSGNANIGVGQYSNRNVGGGSSNIAIGLMANYDNAGNNNTIIGTNSLAGIGASGGDNNTALGANSLNNNAFAGTNNIALGVLAGSLLVTGSDNIYVGNTGGSESATIRIGTAGTHTRTFIAGINGTTIGASAPVLINASGQLGTLVSSRRFKNHIQDIGSVSDLLMQLRPVMFNYNSDDTNQINYGFIAEEVAQIYPELVVFDEDGKPYTVKYHLLYALLLNEIQKNNVAIKELQNNQEHHAALIEENCNTIKTLLAHMTVVENITK